MSTKTPPAFRVPSGIDEALRLLEELPARTVVVGGGTHVMPRLLADPDGFDMAVDVAMIPRLRTLRTSAYGIDIGSAVTYSALLDPAQQRVPRLLKLISGGITGGPQIRNQGTIGGSACYANPASDIPTGLVALGASFVLASRQRGERIVAAERFFKGAFQTDLLPDELLVDILLPHDTDGDRWGYVKLKSAESSWPIATAAARLKGPNGGPATLTVTIGGACTRPILLEPITLDTVQTLGDQERALIAANVARSNPVWWTDELADAAYRMRVAVPIAMRAAEAAMQDGAKKHG